MRPHGGAATTPHDAPAVALGNASLLGLGYLMLGRRLTAVAAGMVTAALVSMLVAVARPWCEILVLFWWAAVVAHGWFLAGGRARPGPARPQRLIALGVTASTLLAVGLLRFDAVRIEHGVTEARESGDCAGVLTAQDRTGFGHRIVGAPLAARGDAAVEACRRLDRAEAELTAGLTGDTEALKAGFGTLASVLAEPGNRMTSEVVLNGFLGRLPTGKPCETLAVTEWLRHRKPSHDVLDRSESTVRRAEPAALLGCADGLMAAEDWEGARTRYQQLLGRYGDDERSTQARKGVQQATRKIELAHVRELLEGTPGTQPQYCSTPAKYSGADPYREGTNRALFHGDDEYTGKLPDKWRADDVTDAVLVVCAGQAEHGTPTRTCPYEGTFPRFPTDVTFHKIKIPVKVYELRTGKPVAGRKVEIGGTSCPAVLQYTYYGYTDYGPPSDVYVEPSKADIRDAFRPLIER